MCAVPKSWLRLFMHHHRNCCSLLSEITTHLCSLKRCGRSGPGFQIEELSRLIHQAGQVLTATNTLSLTATEMIVPPMIEEFYGRLTITIESGSIANEDIAMANSICESLGLSTVNSRTTTSVSTSVDDGAIAMTHKLRWHDGTSKDRVQYTAPSHSRIRRPHFAATGGKPTTALTVFAREE